MDSFKETTFIGRINVILAIVGIGQLIVNVIGYYSLPTSFIDEYGPFMKMRFPAMAIMTAVVLPLLGGTGFLLLRKVKHSVLLCNFFFVFEILVLIAFLYRWNLPFLPVAPAMIFAGLTNGAIALQIVTLYPIVGLVLLNRRPNTV